jgi:hypothetical protein
VIVIVPVRVTKEVRNTVVVESSGSLVLLLGQPINYTKVRLYAPSGFVHYSLSDVTRRSDVLGGQAGRLPCHARAFRFNLCF